MKVVLATGNPGKVKEFSEILASSGMTLIPQSDFGVPNIEETGLTFVENALLKARNAAQHTGLAAIADDSGIEVDALNGAPGIYSARYGGEGASDKDNYSKLLSALKGVVDANRTARYRSVIVFLRHADDPSPIIAEGTWEGRILHTARGSGGFGYDPVFFIPTLGVSAAEISALEKNRLSHRGQALRMLREKLAAAGLR